MVVVVRAVGVPVFHPAIKYRAHLKNSWRGLLTIVRPMAFQVPGVVVLHEWPQI